MMMMMMTPFEYKGSLTARRNMWEDSGYTRSTGILFLGHASVAVRSLMSRI
jgi:hypothetical protein